MYIGKFLFESLLKIEEVFFYGLYDESIYYSHILLIWTCQNF